MANEIYDKTVFKRFFEENDPKVLAWAENVLAKICGPGTLPVYLNKEGEDFKSFWGTITHLFALIVIYARQYNEIDVNKILFDLFIKNRGLVTSEINTTEQMQYLFNNYINEYEKRGRLDIVSKEGVILGELLRLIQYQTLDEFIFALLSSRDTGWTLGYSSPTWSRTDTITNITKGYETTVNVMDLDKYPLINPTGVLLIQDQDNLGNPVQSMTFVGNVLTGIGSTEDQSKLFIISENLPYQISCRVKVSSVENQNLTFGVQVYDELKRPISLIEGFGPLESNEFTSGNTGLQLVNDGVYYELRGTISKKNRTFIEQLFLNFPNGRGLKMVEGAKYLSLYFVQDRSKPCSDVYIYDIKVKPLYLPFTQGYLGEKNIIASYYENNSAYANTTINEFIETYLISYKNVLKAGLIVAASKVIVYFKVFSDRKVYLSEATIEIAGQTLTTNANGEATIELYSGDYLYSVSKEKFIPVENEVVTIGEEEVQIVYVSLKGDLYERRVIFSVRDENNTPISGATVTFNGKFQNTGPDGTTIFMAYPDLYSYTVTKDKYQVVNKSVLVQDDMVENVILELIPISTLTFVVKNGNLPVSGVQITLVNDQQQTETSQLIANETLILITGDDGTCVFKDVINGNYRYSAEKIDWLPTGGSLEVKGDQTINIAFSPVPTYTVTFVVYDYNPFTKEKSLLQGASVTYAGMSKISDSKGEVSFIVKGNSYNYQISATGFVEQSGNILPTEDVTKTIDLVQIQYPITFKVTGYDSIALKNATVKVGDQTQQTNENGEVVFQLPNGNYSYIASYQEYHSKTDDFVVNKGPQLIRIPLDQVLYNVTFTVKEENIISVGAKVTFGNQSKTTSNQGIATFQVPIGSYQWSVEKTIYVSQSGNIDVTGYAITREINLIRKSGDVTFYVSDDNGNPIESAVIICGGQTKSTNVNGLVDFTLPIADYSYDVSKLPDFTSQSGNISITETAQRVNILLSNKKYSVIFNIAIAAGGVSSSVYNIPVELDGITKYTDRNGKVTFPDKKNGYYNYSVARNSGTFTTKTGSVNISNSDSYVNIVLEYELKTITFMVVKDRTQTFPNCAIGGTIYYENGTVYSYVNARTDSSGNYVMRIPKNGSFTLKTEDSTCVNRSLSGTESSPGSVIFRLFTSWILTFSVPAQTIINSIGSLDSRNAEASGNTLKLCEPISTPYQDPADMYVSFKGITSLLSVDQWPVNWGLSYGDEMFKDCVSLRSLATNMIPSIKGSIRYMFQNCTNLRSLPDRFFSKVTGLSAYGCCWGSGITSVGSYLFSNTIGDYEYAFRGCQNLSSVNGYAFGSGADYIGGIFYDSSVSSVNGYTFALCTKATSINYVFGNCPNLRTVPGNLFQNCKGLREAKGSFSSSGITAIPAGLFNYITTPCDFGVSFHDCQSLSSVGSNAFPVTVTSFSWTFKKCKSLRTVGGIKRAYPNCTNAGQMFMESGLQTLDGNFFQGWNSLAQAAETFRDCTSLTSVTTGGVLFGSISNLINISSLFHGCINLAGVVTLVNDVINTFKKVTTYNYIFYNCAKLTSTSVYASGILVPLYAIVDEGIRGGYFNATRTQGYKGCTRILQSTIPPSSAWV